MIFIILPQSLFNMIPSFVNQFVSLTKDTSLAFIIGVNELTKATTPSQQPHAYRTHGNFYYHRPALFRHLLLFNGIFPLP